MSRNYVHVLDVAIPADVALRFEGHTELLMWLALMPDYKLRALLLSIPYSFVVR